MALDRDGIRDQRENLLSFAPMISRNTKYQRPGSLGSLSGALQMWLAIQPEAGEPPSHHLAFTLSCSSESRATRVAGALRRRRDCGAAAIVHAPREDRDGWDVVGTTRVEIQSLRGLERLSTWLSQTAASHQVRLTHLALVMTEP